MNHRAYRTPRHAAVVLAVGVAASQAALAQSSASATALRETVVTATRTDSRADELVSEVVVIERAAIEAAAGRTLPELLAREAGLQFASNGGFGQLSSVFIRGTSSRHAVLLVDGVRLGSATAGIPIWETLPLEAIERIEVLKGPASALYGSDAAGGVVQVFTRKGQQGFRPGASVTAGSRGHAQATAGFAGGEGPLGYSLGVQRTVDGGFSATNPRQPWNYNPDRDPFRQDAFNASLRYDINRDWRADASVLYSDAISHFDDGPGLDARSALRASVVQGGVKGRLLPAWQTELRVSQGTDTNNSIQASWPGSYRTAQNQVTWQNTVDTRLGAVLAGLEQRVQKVTSTTAYVVKERTIDAAFAGLNGSAGAHSWQANLRHDRNSQFGNADTGFAGYGYRLSPAWRVHASYGTSFVAPSFNDLYYPGWSNPLLQPERGRNRDLGLAWSEGAHEVKLVHFDNRIRGFITSGMAPVNVPHARIDGWTLGYTGRVGAFALRASVDSLDPRDEVTGRRLPRRADTNATAGAEWARGDWRLGGTVLHVGQRFDDTANTKPLDAYTTLDVHAAWQFARDLSLQARVNNLTDRKYETVLGYNQPGRSAYLTLRWQPK
ncbi:TonB-dependent receptor domain-containing protein [Ramlibacter sp. MAHUQ-53]|uniref:TonB-dependent receptor domain-containing protein n=1 Tax=unclassified Ramlibacter TaxID=2617605 RepID=UPI00363CDBB6